MTDSQAEEFLRAVRLLPAELRKSALAMPEQLKENAEEFRLRAGRPAFVLALGRETALPHGAIISPELLQTVLEIATRASVHSYCESISEGYVTAQGGCRLGLCGSTAVQNGTVSGFRRLSSICIRIPREKRGCGDGVFKSLTQDGFFSSLIVSPPGAGKTTLLRELIRRLSDGGTRVALADERCEVAGVFEGSPCFDVGAKTDVLSGAPKEQGIMLLLRAMAPQVIAFDEISDPRDAKAAEAAANCGVRLLATAHAGSLEELRQRSVYRELLQREIFKKAVFIESCGGRREYRVEELS